MGFLIAEKRHH